MSKRRYNSGQQAALDLLASIHLDKVKNKAIIRARIEAELRDALNDLALKESRAANEALSLKVAKTDIGRALGTANFQTIRDVLARTAHDHTSIEFDTIDQALTLEDGLWYATDPSGFRALLSPDGSSYAYQFEPGPVGREWDETPIIPTAEWQAWFEVNRSEIAQRVRAVA